uniref:Uncharacterized protein n=1 Tax=Arundo donax TaxID=35708 RepID=A0A0A9ADR4_ARUDO
MKEGGKQSSSKSPISFPNFSHAQYRRAPASGIRLLYAFPIRTPVHVAAGDADAADRPRVRGEDAGDGGGDGSRVSALDVGRDLDFAGREEVGVDEDERGGAPAAG